MPIASHIFFSIDKPYSPSSEQGKVCEESYTPAQLIETDAFTPVWNFVVHQF